MLRVVQQQGWVHSCSKTGVVSAGFESVIRLFSPIILEL